MNPPEPPRTARSVPIRPLPDRAYVRMSLVLWLGLGTSLAILVAGLIAYLIQHGGESFTQVVASNPILDYLSFGGLAAGLAGGHVEAYLTLGLLALVATPILRVLSGFYYFERGGERPMAAITLTVAILLFLGLLVLGPWIR